MTKSIIVILIGMTLLTSCATVSTNCPEPTRIDPSTQAQAAEEVASLPENSAIPTVLAAALDDRDKLRACRRIN